MIDSSNIAENRTYFAVNRLNIKLNDFLRALSWV